MLTYGLELEYFVQDSDSKEFVLANRSLPTDACGYLVEARSEPHADPLIARHLLAAATEKLRVDAAEEGQSIVLANTADLPKELRRVALRRFGKNPAKAFFAHGGAYRSSVPRAGLHIHFGSKTKHHYGDKGQSFEYTVPLNVPRIIWFLDEAFRAEIKAAKRVLGEYELKPYGFEYRSLPATIDLTKVVKVLQTLKDDPEAMPDDVDLCDDEGEEADGDE